MAPKAVTVAKLASQAQMDLDEALVSLWDAGIEEVSDPSDQIPARRVSLARRTLRLPTSRQLRSIPYLATIADISVEEAKRRLRDEGVISSGTSERLPKGRVKKARRVLGITGPQVIASLTMGSTALAEPEEESDFEWTTVGTEQPIEQLTSDEVERIHFALVEDFARSGDPIDPPGIRDRNMLESAVFRPMTAIGDEIKYPTVPMAGGALFHSLVLNHAFLNGNKRTAVVSILVFLDKNRNVLQVSEDELFRYVLLVAQHRIIRRSAKAQAADREAHAIASWICDKMRRVKRDEYPVRWRDLKRTLTSYKCELQVVTGNRMNIWRPMPRAGLFGSRKPLKTQVFYADDGREAELNTVHKIRKDLHLDEEHGIDSEVFYRGQAEIDTFIAKYRKTLVRLARV